MKTLKLTSFEIEGVIYLYLKDWFLYVFVLTINHLHLIEYQNLN